jgi:hypothetical protein
MFKNKLLKALLAPFFMWVDDLDGGGGAADTGGSSDFDMSGALDSISEGLGFGGEADPDLEVDPEVKPDPEAKPADTQVKEPAAATPPADPAAKPLEAPKTWRPEAAAEFAKLPVTVQQEVLKREEDIFKGLEAYKADATVGKSFSTVLQPFQPLLQQHNVDPVRLTANLMQAHATLSLGTPEQKQQLFAKLAADYGVTLPQAASGEEAPYTDPAVQALQAEIKALQSQLSGTQQQQRQFAEQQQAEVRSKLTAEIDAFAADPAHPHFDEVSSDMVAFIKQGMSLKDAYDKAVWANPVTRAKEIERTTAESKVKAEAEAKAKAEAARKATAVNVKAKPKQAGAATPLGSLDDTLNAAYAKLTTG